MNNRLNLISTPLSTRYAELTPAQRDFIYLLGYFVLSLFSWIITNKASAYAAKWLGNLAYGDFGGSLRLTHNLAHLFVMGQEATLLLYLSKYQHNPEKQTGLIQWIIRSTLLKTTLVLLSVAIALMFNTPWLNRTLWIGFTAMPFVVICGIYERFFLFLKHFFISFIPRGIFHPILFIGFIYLVYAFNPSTEVALSLYTLAYFLSGIAAAIFGYHSGFVLTETSDQSDKQTWRVAGIFYTISTLIIKSTPTMTYFFLKKLGPEVESVAHFVALCNLIYGFHLLTKPFDSYLKPYVARLYADNEIESLQNIINFVNLVRWSTILILFLSLSFYGHHFLNEYGEGFSKATFPLAAFSFMAFLQYLGQPAHEILNYTGYQKELAIIMFLQCALIALLGILLIPSLGIWGAVLSQGIPCVLATLISGRYLYRKTKLKAYFVF